MWFIMHYVAEFQRNSFLALLDLYFFMILLKPLISVRLQC